jgi:thymidylate synthase
VTGYEPGEFIWTGGDVHIYRNHFDQAQFQLKREPKKLPVMRFGRAVPDIFAFRYQDFVLEGYEPYPAIKAEVSV